MVQDVPRGWSSSPRWPKLNGGRARDCRFEVKYVGEIPEP
nr:MAG TPA: hypothetical protein [Caudoviricetes sp.]